MKLKALDFNVTRDSAGNPILHLKIDKSYYGALSRLTKEDEYMVSIGKFRNNRSIQQNKMMWAFLEIMANSMNGGMSGEGMVTSWDCYISMLELSNAKYEFIACRPEAVEYTKQQFRAAKELQRKILADEEGKKGEYVIMKCWIGSSEYDTKEMTVLIDAIINQLASMEIDVSNQADMASLEAEYKEWRKNK